MFMLSIIPGIAMFGMGTGVPGGATLSSGMEHAPIAGVRTLAILSSRDAATWRETILDFNASPTLCRRLSFIRWMTLPGSVSWPKAAPQLSSRSINIARMVSILTPIFRDRIRCND